MDVLHHQLARARASGSAFARTVRYGGWGLSLDAAAPLVVHVVVSGRLVLWCDADEPVEPVELGPGEIALVSGARPHRMADRAGAACLPLEQFRHASPGGPGDGPAVDFLCGAYRFEGDAADEIVAALPPVLVVRPGSRDRVRLAVDLLAWELADPAMGQQSAVDRLLDVVLVQLLREAFGRDGEHAPPWYAAAQDPRLAGALRALHEQPGAPWTVPALADLAGLSRAAFARAFTERLGRTPMAYLASLRMSVARDLLRDPAHTLAHVAREVGYADAYGFAAAFKRAHGTSPGRWRRQVLASGEDPPGAEPGTPTHAAPDAG